MKTHVWYHTSCYDGFGAAWAASQFLGRGSDVIYTPVAYGKPHPDFNQGDMVYIVDFSYPRDILLKIKEKANSVVVLDHHLSAEKDLKDLDFCVFDMERSGAGITWDYFNQQADYKEFRPKMIDMIEDRDLWKFKDPDSKAFHAYLLSQPFDFESWDMISFTLETDSNTILKIGRALLQASEQQVKNIVTKSFTGNYILTYPVAMVNTSSHWSEVGAELLAKHPEVTFVASFTIMPDKSVMWSLRSKGDFDVSVIAKHYGGGGHKNAAGFRSNIDYLAEFL